MTKPPSFVIRYGSRSGSAWDIAKAILALPFRFIALVNRTMLWMPALWLCIIGYAMHRTSAWSGALAVAVWYHLTSFRLANALLDTKSTYEFKKYVLDDKEGFPLREIKDRNFLGDFFEKEAFAHVSAECGKPEEETSYRSSG